MGILGLQAKSSVKPCVEKVDYTVLENCSGDCSEVTDFTNLPHSDQGPVPKKIKILTKKTPP